MRPIFTKVDFVLTLFIVGIFILTIGIWKATRPVKPSEGEIQRCFIVEIDGMDYLQYQIDGKWGLTAASFMKSPSKPVDDSSDTAVGL